MPDTTYSSAAWTGPPAAMSAPYRHTFTHRVGTPSTTSDYVVVRDTARLAGRLPAELRPVLRSAMLLLVSQLGLWISSVILNTALDDWRIADLGDWLVLWAFGAFGIAMWQIASRSVRLVLLRRTMLVVLILATLGLAVGNVYLGIRSKRAAIASRPERVFVLFSSRGKKNFRKTVANFQRADGSFADGRSAIAPIPYGTICATVQRLDGPDGFSWIRVRERSRSPTNGQLAWPIRREECFSSIPLATLPR